MAKLERCLGHELLKDMAPSTPAPAPATEALAVLSMGRSTVTASRAAMTAVARELKAAQTCKARGDLPAFVAACGALQQLVARSLPKVHDRLTRLAAAGGGVAQIGLPLGPTAARVQEVLQCVGECVEWQQQDARARADERERERITAEQAAQAQQKADQVTKNPNNPFPLENRKIGFRDITAQLWSNYPLDIDLTPPPSHYDYANFPSQAAQLQLEAERKEGAVSVTTAMALPGGSSDLAALVAEAGAVPSADAVQVLTTVAAGGQRGEAGSGERAVQTAVLRVVAAAAEGRLVSPGTTAAAAVVVAAALRDQPPTRQMRQWFRSLVYHMHPLCVPHFAADYDADSGRKDAALRVLCLYAEVMKADADAWSGDAIQWLHRAAATLHGLQSGGGRGGEGGDEGSAANKGHFSHCCQALKAFLSVNFSLVQDKDPKNAKVSSSSV